MGLWDIFKKLIDTSIDDKTKSTYTEEVFFVAGVHCYLKNINKLACKNPNWPKTNKALINQGFAGKRIFRYNYVHKPVYLIPEPKNAHDKNAILVQIAGEKVGYISQDDNVHVKQILNSQKVKFISAFISGGQYKIVFKNAEMEKQEETIRIKVKIGYS